MLKKIISVFMLFVILLALPVVSIAAEDEIKVRLCGEYLEFDVPPMIINDRTMVPFRAAIEGLGGTVGWDGAKMEITITY